jgi:hypothetical protein
MVYISICFSLILPSIDCIALEALHIIAYRMKEVMEGLKENIELGSQRQCLKEKL